jgi:hypothetical protein
MRSEVYFADARARSEKESKSEKIRTLFDMAGFGEMMEEGGLTAIKVHFGERGSDSFISPLLVRQAVDKVKESGAKPFVTDTNTLYGGGRGNTVDHLETAIMHGFGYSVLGAPLIIADGLRSESYSEVEVRGKHFSSVKVARSIAEADSMIVFSHFKGHILSGFGGSVKNLGMGCAPAAGKADQHSTKPVFNQELCQGCKRCEKACPVNAVTVESRISKIDYNACRGCGECLRICPAHAIDLDWLVQIPPFLERMAEHALCAAKTKSGAVGYFNFLINITPDCDCLPWSDAPIVPDIGILASRDPVAIDKASLDLVNAQRGIADTLLQSNLEPGKDKFKGVWPYTDAIHLIEYSQEIGLGSADYRLIEA